MTLKMHFLNNHLDCFLQQSPKDSDEQGELFHQIILSIEKRFKAKKIDSMLGEICWWTRNICPDADEEDKSENEDESEDEEVDETERIDSSNSGSEGSVDEDENEDEPQQKRMRASTS